MVIALGELYASPQLISHNEYYTHAATILENPAQADFSTWVQASMLAAVYEGKIGNLNKAFIWINKAGWTTDRIKKTSREYRELSWACWYLWK